MNFTAPLMKTWKNAFLLSFSAVNFFVLALGVGIVPFKADDIWQECTQSITYCYLHNGEIAISAVWTHNLFGREDRLVAFPLNSDAPRMQTPWSTLLPNAVTGDPARGLIFVGTANGGVYSVDANHLGDPPILIGRHPGAHVQQLACSSDGRWLVSIHDDSLYVWDLAEKKLLGVWKESAVQCVALTLDSKRAICGLNNGSVVEIDLARRSCLRSVAKHTSPIVAVAVCPRSGQIAALCFTGHLQVVSESTGEVVWERVQGWSPPVLTFSEDGQIVVSSGKVGEGQGLIIYQSDSGTRLANLGGFGTEIRGVAFNGDKQLVSWGSDGTLHVWNPECLRNPTKSTTAPPCDLFETSDRIIVPRWDSLLRNNVQSVVRSSS